MSQGTVQNGKNFKERFAKNYKGWADGQTFGAPDDELDRAKHLSPESLKKEKEKNVKTEEDRVESKSALVPKQKIFGFENEIKSMKNFLLDRKVYKEFKSLVVVGEYGVGKTALCQTIFNDEDVKSVYAPMIWVSMTSLDTGAETDRTKISALKKIFVLKKILKDLGVTPAMFKFFNEEADQEAAGKREKGLTGITTETEELSALLYALHLNLRWKKYLIVFDDVREEDEWDERLDEKLKEDEEWGRYLSDGFPKGSGGRVIYTTRDEKKVLAKKLVAEEHERHRLWPLTDPKSVWDIYAAAVTDNGVAEPPRNDKKCLDELMNKSRGLPLALRLMAGLLPVFLDDEQTEGTNTGNNQSTPAESGTTPPLLTS